MLKDKKLGNGKIVYKCKKSDFSILRVFFTTEGAVPGGGQFCIPLNIRYKKMHWYFRETTSTEIQAKIQMLLQKKIYIFWSNAWPSYCFSFFLLLLCFAVYFFLCVFLALSLYLFLCTCFLTRAYLSQNYLHLKLSFSTLNLLPFSLFLHIPSFVPFLL